MDCSPPGSSIHGIFQARGLEWGAIAFSGLSATVAFFSVTLAKQLTLVCLSKRLNAYLLSLKLRFLYFPTLIYMWVSLVSLGVAAVSSAHPRLALDLEMRRNKPPEQSNPSLKGLQGWRECPGCTIDWYLKKTKDEGRLTGPNDISKKQKPPPGSVYVGLRYQDSLDKLDKLSSSRVAIAAKSLQSCPTLCNPIDSSPPGSAIPGILQARTLEWVAISLSNAWKWKVKVKSLSHVRILVTPWTAAQQAPPSMGFSRQDYWSGVPLPSPGVELR